MPTGVIASTQSEEDWEPRDKDLKRYIHFDRDVSLKKIRVIANDTDLVASHAFFPLLRFHEEWTKFRKKNERKKKVRPLRYAARIDAAIYARYRVKLSKLYENELRKRDLADVPVAYRRLPKENGGNKCNIDFSKDVFSFVRDVGDCVVTVVDIKSYFESLDHSRILSVWKALIGADLPPDHEALFRAITKYSVVDVDKLFERLELNKLNSSSGNRAHRRMRKIDELRAANFKQICSPREFRELVLGTRPGIPSLLQKNGFDFGIPQGTPLSDLIANFYLIDFDEEVNRWVCSKGGLYRRYSDDIVVVLPKSASSDPLSAKAFLQETIKNYGRQLRIQDRKVCVAEFCRADNMLDFKHISGTASRNGLEYLGFEYNGRNVKIKNSTLSNAWRKIKRRSYGYASRFVKRYRDKGHIWMVNNYPGLSLETKMLRDVTFNQDIGFDTWTFVKYVRRSSVSFIGFNPMFYRQTKRYRRYTRLIVDEAFNRALKKHG